MTPEQAAAYIMGQAACLNATVEGMKAANLQRLDQGKALAYGTEAFLNAINDHQCHHNAVCKLFDGVNG